MTLCRWLVALAAILIGCPVHATDSRRLYVPAKDASTFIAPDGGTWYVQKDAPTLPAPEFTLWFTRSPASQGRPRERLAFTYRKTGLSLAETKRRMGSAQATFTVFGENDYLVRVDEPTRNRRAVVRYNRTPTGYFSIGYETRTRQGNDAEFERWVTWLSDPDAKKLAWWK